MREIELENLNDLIEKLESGELSRDKLVVRVDNDCTCFHYKDSDTEVFFSHDYNSHPRLLLEDALEKLLGCEVGSI